MFLDRLFFILLLVFLPTQLSRHFFINTSFVQGIRVDYLTPTLYLTDLLLVLMLVSWFIRRRKNLTKAFCDYFKKNTTITLFIIILGFINLLVSQTPQLVLFKQIKLIELFLLGSYIFIENISFQTTLNCLFVGGIYTSLLAVLQFFKQGSIGGLWWFFGERTFSIQTPGIAKAIIFGKLLLRPYATFPHPNVLAAFMVLLLPFLIFNIPRVKKASTLYIQLLIIIFTTTLFLTLSRIGTTIGIAGIIMSLLLIKKQAKTKKGLLLKQSIIFTALILFFGFLIFGRYQSLFQNSEDTILQRNELARASWQLFKKNPLFGTGLNNFLPRLPTVSHYAYTYGYFQPTHNTFLLILAESGIVGLMLFLFLLYKTFKNIQNQKTIYQPVYLIVFSAIIVFLLTDHYFYTLQQGQLLFTILIGFMIKKEHGQTKENN